MDERASLLTRTYGRRGMVAAVGLSISSILLTGGSAASGSAAGAFCKDRIVHDYGRAFKSMPGLTQAPKSGQLPFAPKAVSFDTPGTSILVSVGSQNTSLNYRLTVPSGLELKRRVTWRMSGRLDRVNAKGVVLRSVGAREVRIFAETAKELDGSGFTFNMNAKPAFYRAQIEFRQDSGRLLKKYGEYFRVVSPTRHTDLALSPDQTVGVGQEIRFKVTNAGTLPARYGEAFVIDRRVPGGWTPYPLDLGPWHQQLFGLGPGLSGTCQGFKIPAGMEAGQYRVRKEMRDPPHLIAAPFEVG